MDNKKKLSVIVVSYENLEVLRGCLDSIFRFNDLNDGVEVIVVEQSREECIYDTLLSDYPWVKVIRSENKGFGAGNNVGARIANGELFLFLNPDTALVEPIFEYAFQIHKSRPHLGMFGFRLLDSEGRKNKSFHFRKPYGIARALVWRICDKLDIYIPQLMYIAGADMFVPSEAFWKTGGFNESMFMYFEETFLCNRLDSLGYTTGFYPEKKIIHLEGRSSSTINTLQKQIDSLRALFENNEGAFRDCLNRMCRDRRFKSFFPGRKAACLSEISLIETVLSGGDRTDE